MLCNMMPVCYARIMSRERRGFAPVGQVQGVGFRPFVFRLAREHGVSGSVENSPEGVRIEAQGDPAALDAFARDLLRKAPPLARVDSCGQFPLSLREDETDFVILPSRSAEPDAGHEALISPDVSVCEECLAEMRDAANRRHGYAFTNCTNCGPRYTVTRSVPYDRANTSMSCFPLCPACGEEYENPSDRRFHAQPNACPLCGPRLWTALPGSAASAPDGLNLREHSDARALAEVALALRGGKIAAVKGLGGFHLACDAADAEAVAELRRRKRRPHKALAVMVPSLEHARRLALLTPEEEALLACPERPVTICGQPLGAVAPNIAPDDATLGIMLPYTPLHHTLLDAFAALLPAGKAAALVMTSGNAGGEPICLGNREALNRLSRIADVFLLHNRDILVRADDSVLRPLSPSPSVRRIQASPSLLVYRRARGYVPRPLQLGGKGPCVLGTGAELKSTLCVTRGERAFVGQHIGDLQNAENLRFYREVADHLLAVLRVRPEAVICDLHPDYLSTRYAQDSGLPLHRLQHHFAHLWSVSAEHGIEGALLGLSLDGTGYGEDGSIWGGELLFADTQSLEQRRLGRLSPFALPGGESAVREPWRIAQGFLEELNEGKGHAWPWLEGKDADVEGARAVGEMLRRDVNCPRASSCGRLFDAVAALLGLCTRITYEGQAALRLEAALGGTRDITRSDGSAPRLEFPLRERGDLWEADTRHFMNGVIRACVAGVSAAALSRAFHAALARTFADMALAAARGTGVRRIALSGGVLQNAALMQGLTTLLSRGGLIPLTPVKMPAHDGGVSLGQAAWGRRFLA
jgi:hydrogenase maturation protein HypF